MKIALPILLQIVLIFLNAIFSMAEIAVISISEAKLQKMAEKGNKRAKRLAKFKSHPAKFLSTIQVSITLAGFLGSAFAAEYFAEPLTVAIVKTGINIPVGVINTVCVIFITIILAYFNIVFGELVPKRIAMKRSEKIAFGLSGTLKFFSIIFAPVVWLLTKSTNLLLRMFGINPHEKEEEVTEEDILLMAEAGSESGAIESSENELIKNIFDFKEQDVGEVCTHRRDVDVLYIEDTDEEWAEIIKQTRHTYYPICDRDISDVVGVLNTKDYFRLEDQSRESVMQHAVSPAVFVSENTTADTLFHQMKQNREYFMVVLDEYGDMSGIISLHDLIELLVGDIIEKGDEEEYSITQLEDDKWEIKGFAPIDEVEESLNIEFSEEEKDDYDTFGGYVAGIKGIIPEDGTTFELQTEQLIVQVLTIDEHCITKMHVTVKPKPTDEDDEDEDKEEND